MPRRPFFATLIALALITVGTLGAGAQDTSEVHPVVGAWIVSTPSGPAIEVFHAHGTYTASFPVTGAPPTGVTFQSTQVGVWEPTDDRTAHLSVVFLYSDAAGNFTGSFTYDGTQSVSDDGHTIRSNDGGTATVRDAGGNVTLELVAGDGVVVGARMEVGAPGFPTGQTTLPTEAP
jgi:hypothetical protein